MMFSDLGVSWHLVGAYSLIDARRFSAIVPYLGPLGILSISVAWYTVHVRAVLQKSTFYYINGHPKEYILVDTIFNYRFHLGLPGTCLYLSPPKGHFLSDFSEDMFPLRWQRMFLCVFWDRLESQSWEPHGPNDKHWIYIYRERERKERGICLFGLLYRNPCRDPI